MRILVIKLSALGDMIQALPAFAAIRAAHRQDHITLLTTPSFAELATASPYFDTVQTDGRPSTLQGWLHLVRGMRRAAYHRVYDLQTNDRTNLYFQALRPRPPIWSGAALGCALPHARAKRMAMHTLDRQAEQLRAAGIEADPGALPDVSWLIARAHSRPQETHTRRLALLVPGASPKRPEKRWPAGCYAELAVQLISQGFAVAVIGGEAERDLARVIVAAAPAARDLTGQTDLAALAGLGAQAALAVGNDTGPMHLLAAAGAPCLVLFSGASDPALCAPRGRVTVLQSCHLTELSVNPVLGAALTCARAGP